MMLQKVSEPAQLVLSQNNRQTKLDQKVHPMNPSTKIWCRELVSPAMALYFKRCLVILAAMSILSDFLANHYKTT